MFINLEGRTIREKRSSRAEVAVTFEIRTRTERENQIPRLLLEQGVLLAPLPLRLPAPDVVPRDKTR